MKEGVHYKCPNAEKCILHKSCHVLKTIEPLNLVIEVLVKCPAQKNSEIKVSIGGAIAQ